MTLYSTDGTQRGDEVAGEMRAYYEANKPLRWWQRRKPMKDSEIADDLMLELRNIVLRAEMNYRAEQDRCRMKAIEERARDD